MTALVSIIMPAYNNAPFVREAVESVLQQSYPRCELIVVDDGSTDGTREVIQPLLSQLRYVAQEHLGSSAARNAGLAWASGEFVAFLDADDLLPRRAIERRMAHFARSPSAAVVCTGWRVVDTEGRPVANVRPWQDGARLDLLSLLLHKQVNNGTITVRRECLDQVGGFDESLKLAQDTDLVFRIAAAGYKLVWLREIGVLYRRRGDSASHQNPRQAQMMDRVLDKVFQSPRLSDTIRRREPEVRYYTHLWYAWHLAQLGYPSGMRDRLRLALQSAADTSPEIAFQWMRIFSRWSHQFAYRSLPPSECYDAFRAVMAKRNGAGGSTPDALEFWWRIWRAYHAGEATAARGALAAYGPAHRETLIRWAQSLIFSSPEGADLLAIGRFWTDARAGGIVPPSNRHEVVGLYLSVCSRDLLRRRWSRALRALWAAAFAGLHPRGLAAWLHFTGWALPRALKVLGRPSKVVRS